MVQKRSFTTQAIVLKRANAGEADKIVTLLTQDYGKIACIVKSIRKINSSKKATFEPGNIVQVFFVKTKNLPILSQATLIDDSAQAKSTLAKIRQLSQVLEIFDKLCVEDESQQEIYSLAIEIIDQLSHHSQPTKIKSLLRTFIISLGYQDPNKTSHQSIIDYVSEISEQKMKSFEYLQI